jgi:hypothetical protein
MDEKTCRECISLILKRGGRFRNKQLEHDILRDYGVQCQNNTIAKYLSFLINDGKVLSAPVIDSKNGTCFEYWWIESKKKVVAIKREEPGLVDRCVKIADTFPDGHPEQMKILLQIEQIEAQERKVA